MKAMRWYTPDHGFRHVLISNEGRKWMTVLMIDADGLHRKRVPLTECRYMTEVNSTKKTWRNIARRDGTTKAAKRDLRVALAT